MAIKTLAVSLALVIGLAGCKPPPPCEDDYCRQARLMILQGMLNNSNNQPRSTIYFAPCTINARIAGAC